MSMKDSIQQEGWYFAQNFLFKGASKGGYIGLQPREQNASGPVIHAAFSSFIDGTTKNDANCYNGADGGPGVSCAVDINGDYKSTYELKVQNAEGKLWSGTLIDTATGRETHIGSWTLPANTAGMKGSWLGFVEWWPFNDRKKSPTCNLLNQTSVSFGIPRTTTSGAGSGSLGDAYEVYDCQGEQNFKSQKIANSVEVTVGFSTSGPKASKGTASKSSSASKRTQY
ncbi:hypothetical protein QQS21_009200 [Conoideocrella luteorostrata]|uniref:Uncharacterized protein n=1 Tax=Conoideocrella luteorostrata TaxID=1105319 RepID=A0AAJ0CHP6_9HYPO|nr:hypothetical protein QQS21_009200 [Conoideocrella luteorostrata]